ncbi:uncharacterized protein PG986_012424 [Apiospora aurea]|uniref:Uncharacterized protein n=1 Tax=Apiospora aurea TaxID=335848 RepID=A0ABR1Q140_9PEZI
MVHPQSEDHNTSQGEYPETLLSRVHDILNANSGNGFMKIREKGQPVKNFGVSMLHQLHCLEILKNIIEHGGEAPMGGGHSHNHGKRAKTETAPRDNLDEIQLADGAGHATHCLEYIAQSILCAADDTLEASFTGRLGTGEKVEVINGIGAVHQCRGSKGVLEALSQSQVEPLVVEKEVVAGERLTHVLRHAAG